MTNNTTENMNATEQFNRANAAYEAASTKADEAEKKVNEAIERGDSEQDIQELMYAHTEAVDILNDAYAECVDIVQGTDYPVEVR